MSTFPILMAAAVTTPPPDVPVFGDFAKILDPLFDAASGYSDVLVGAGKVMLSIALVLESMVLTFDYLVKGGGASDFLHGAFRIFLVALFPATMLATWPELPNAVLGLFASQLPALLNGTNAGDSGTQHIAHAFSGVLHAMQDVLAPPKIDESEQHWWNLLGKTELAIYKVAALMLLSVPMLIFGFALIITLFGPLFLLYIGVIMAPILVPWMVFRPLSSMGAAWVRYMVTMGVAFVIGLVMAAIVVKAIGDYATVINSQTTALDSFGAMIFGLFPQMILLLFLAYMMLKVEHIAGAMVGGASIGGGAAMAAMMAGALAKGGGGGSKGGDKGGKADGGGDGGKDGGGKESAGQSTLSKQAANASTTSAPASADSPKTGGAGNDDKGSSSQASLSKGAADASGSAAPASADSPKAGGAGITSEASSGAGGAAPSGSSPQSSASDGKVSGRSAPTAPSAGGEGSHSRFSPAARSAAKKAAKTAGKVALAVAVPPVGLAMGAYAMSPRVRGMTDATTAAAKAGVKGVAQGAMTLKGALSKGESPKDDG